MLNERLQFEVPHEKSPQEQKERVPLTAEYGAKIFFLSYRFSQGNSALQRYVFDFFHLLRPYWRITDALKKEISQIVKPQIENFLGVGKKYAQGVSQSPKGTYHPEIGNAQFTGYKIDDAVYLELGEMEKSFNGRKKYFRQRTIKELAEGISILEHNWLVVKGGRPRKPAQSQKVTTATDPFFSQLCYYGFLGHSTGVKEYDEMFREVATYIRSALVPPRVFSWPRKPAFAQFGRLSDVVRVYNEHHPDSKVSIEINTSKPKSTA